MSSGRLIVEAQRASKAKLTMSMTRRHNKVAKSRSMRRMNTWAYKIAEWVAFKTFMLGTIIVSCIWVGYSIDNDPNLAVPQDNGSRTEVSMELVRILDNVMCSIFCVEQLIRVASYKRPVYYVTDPINGSWNSLDLAVQLINVLNVWILANVNETETVYMRVLKITRLFRLIRFVRLIPDLVILFRAIVAATRSVVTSLVPMVSIIYCFGVIMTEWCNAPTEDRLPTFGQYFDSVGQSMLTMWQIAVFDDSFSIIRPVMHDSPGWGLLLIVFMFLASFMILNVLVGVIREVVYTTTNSYRERFLQNELEDIYDLLDVNEDGKIYDNVLSMLPAKTRLIKLGLKEDIIPNMLHQMDPYATGFIPREVFVLFLLRTLRPPQAQELIIALKTVLAIRGLLHAKKYQLCKTFAPSSDVPPVDKFS